MDLIEKYFKERDHSEHVSDHYFWNKQPEITRNDEIDYEIDRLLKD